MLATAAVIVEPHPVFKPPPPHSMLTYCASQRLVIVIYCDLASRGATEYFSEQKIIRELQRLAVAAVRNHTHIDLQPGG